MKRKSYLFDVLSEQLRNRTNILLCVESVEWLPKSPEPEAHVKTSDSNSRSNLNLEMLVIE